MKPLSLEEIKEIEASDSWECFDYDNNFERLLHTARLAHQMREALEKMCNEVETAVFDYDAREQLQHSDIYHDIQTISYMEGRTALKLWGGDEK